MITDIENFFKKLEKQAVKLKRKTLDLPDIKIIFLKEFEYIEEGERWSLLLKWLKELEEQELITFSMNSPDISSKIPLPKQIKFLNPKWLESKKNKERIYWKPELIEFEKVQLKKEGKTRLKLINEFLGKPNVLDIPLPIKERSLQILGEEKALNSLVSQYHDRVDFLKILNCYHTYEPIIGKIYKDSISNLVYVLENRDTYESFVRFNEEQIPSKFKCVFYGAGNTILQSFHSLLSQISEDVNIRYFGDIDHQGIIIAQGFINRIKQENLDINVEVAHRCYEKLIDLYKNRNCDFPAKSTKKELKYLGIFSKEVFTEMERLLGTNQKIPQELLNFLEIKELFQR